MDALKYKYIFLLYMPNGVLRREVEAETYWEALAELLPGNDVSKIEAFIV